MAAIAEVRTYKINYNICTFLHYAHVTLHQQQHSISYRTEYKHLSKAHVTCDSSCPATLTINVQQKIIKHLERVLKFEASIWKTP